LKELTKVDDAIVRICTDSEYSINCLTKWVVNWRKKGWKTSEGNPVVHRELIEKILKELEGFAGHQFCHIKAHTGLSDEDSVLNDAADRLARKSVEECRRIAYEELHVKQIRSGETSDHVLKGIPLALMGAPVDEETLFKSLLENTESIDKKYLKSALLTALKKTLLDKSYDLEKTKIHKTTAYRLIEKTHLTIERVDE
jgi:ribonuclease HI